MDIRVKRKQGVLGTETLKPGGLGVIGDYLYYGNRGANDESDNTPIAVARHLDVFPASVAAYSVLGTADSVGVPAFRTINAAYVGLSNVTNHAQVKKQVSATVNGNIPTWNVTTGDSLGTGYTVQTTLSSSDTALVRADAIATALGTKLNTNNPAFTGTMSGPSITNSNTTLNIGTFYTASGQPTSILIGDGTVAVTAHNSFTAPTPTTDDNSTKVATTAYVRATISAQLASNDAMIYKGGINASTNPNYPAANAGDFYKITNTGKIGGASGPNVEVGDSLICGTDSSAAGTHATVGANWTILQTNIDGAVVGPASSTDGQIPAWSGTTGKVLGTGYAIVDSSSSAAIGTGTGIPTERDVYYGLVVVNNTSQTRATGIYAPVGAGTSGQLLIAAGGTSAPTWVTGTSSHVGLGNVTNESKATMFTNPTFTGNVILNTIQKTNNSDITLTAGDSGLTTSSSISIGYNGILALSTVGGSVTAPTVTSGDNSTKIATTAFVKAQGYTTNTGTVTSVTASGALSSSGGTTPAITHSTSAGYIHLPAGGAAGNALVWSAAGTAAWTATLDAGAW
jgi:hypothetical protein